MNEEQEWEGVRAALRGAGIDPTDLARFVNASNPAIRGLEPSTLRIPYSSADQDG